MGWGRRAVLVPEQHGPFFGQRYAWQPLAAKGVWAQQVLPWALAIRENPWCPQSCSGDEKGPVLLVFPGLCRCLQLTVLLRSTQSKANGSDLA